MTGASGGAILSPLVSIPAQLVNREPCHNSILQNKQMQEKRCLYYDSEKSDSDVVSLQEMSGRPTVIVLYCIRITDFINSDYPE